MVETLKVAVLGAPKVGKTAIIRQFLYNDFTDTYSPTGSRDIYRPSVIYNGNMYDMKIMDVPYLTAFPANSSQEWLDLTCRGLRNTNAIVLVYDICNPESFEYVKMVQQQILENRWHQRGPHHRGGEQAGPAEAALHAASDTLGAGEEELEVRLHGVLCQIQLAHCPALQGAAEQCAGPGLQTPPLQYAPPGGAAHNQMQPHVRHAASHLQGALSLLCE
ncbi:ras-like protein family member 10A isoform X1 [Chrysemys picta bellii]|uniref:ras-like protein family member 10A isoform X1 n=1 Tax=Chrysemys picta bellii TaxID=8478 RepID=UPI0032B1BA12